MLIDAIKGLESRTVKQKNLQHVDGFGGGKDLKKTDAERAIKIMLTQAPLSAPTAPRARGSVPRHALARRTWLRRHALAAAPRTGCRATPTLARTGCHAN